MVIIGWLFCVAVMILVSISTCLVAFDNLGMYNIGGVRNTGADRFFAIFFICCLTFVWCMLFINAPFTLSMK